MLGGVGLPFSPSELSSLLNSFTGLLRAGASVACSFSRTCYYECSEIEVQVQERRAERARPKAVHQLGTQHPRDPCQACPVAPSTPLAPLTFGGLFNLRSFLNIVSAST